MPSAGTHVAPSPNHADCVITTSGLFFFFFSLPQRASQQKLGKSLKPYLLNKEAG